MTFAQSPMRGRAARTYTLASDRTTVTATATRKLVHETSPMTTPRFGTLFHFTHLDNLSTILREGALLSDAVVQGRGLLSNECGHPGIKDRRRRIPVPCEPGGMVADYVPFYYAARSPMMLTIASGNVPTFTGDHHDFVYFVTDVSTASDLGHPCVVSDRNASVDVAEFSNDLTVLGDLSKSTPGTDFVDWSVMNLVIWKNTAAYPDRMERRMAEFLVHGTFPLEGVRGIATHNSTNHDRVERMFDEAGRSGLRHVVRPGWYY